MFHCRFDPDLLPRYPVDLKRRLEIFSSESSDGGSEDDEDTFQESENFDQRFMSFVRFLDKE